ncbi:MAG: ribonuclease H-like domain-containing protein [Spirochaetaceae bacterium]|nr:ribonuclease H-like domain-containing protein [Spirochaetaceae bacterium]
MSLKNRLRLIRKTGAPRPPAALPESAAPETGPEAPAGWEPLGFKSARRRVTLDFAPPLSGGLPQELPRPLSILIPDLRHYLADAGAGGKLLPEDLLFFDLETTGLSIAAGTVAFLAAFGRLSPGTGAWRGAWRLAVEQYLLLDFPGEPDFLTALLAEFRPSGERPLLVVTYNGKTFDSQILKTRCLFMGMPLPEYHHADLLHPARRLWKRVLPSCSQGVIETQALGLERDGDVPGAEAPDIWFDFLKTGRTERLDLISAHNVRDIAGLASLFAAFADIAAQPESALERYRGDIERLALHWLRQCPPDSPGGDHRTGRALLEAAAALGCPEAVIRRAIEAEWRERNPALALALVEKALEQGPGAFGEALRYRRDRLLGKVRRDR